MSSQNCKKSAFIIPLFIPENSREKLSYFKQTIQSILQQTCSDWLTILIDDKSENPELDDYINNLSAQHENKFVYLKNTVNMGAALSRNKGIEYAGQLQCDSILFLDSDDIAHPERVAVTRDIFSSSDCDVLYSPFIPVDENNTELQPSQYPYNVSIIMDNNKHAIEGMEVWKEILGGAMYINLTSSTSVRTSLACKIPFPQKRTSEDAYAWLLYSASGARFKFEKSIPSKYRIVMKKNYNSLSTAMGKESFWRDYAEVQLEAFHDCTELALQRKAIVPDEIEPLRQKTVQALSLTLQGDGMYTLAKEFEKKFEKNEGEQK